QTPNLITPPGPARHVRSSSDDRSSALAYPTVLGARFARPGTRALATRRRPIRPRLVGVAHRARAGRREEEGVQGARGDRGAPPGDALPQGGRPHGAGRRRGSGAGVALFGVLHGEDTDAGDGGGLPQGVRSDRYRRGQGGHVADTDSGGGARRGGGEEVAGRGEEGRGGRAGGGRDGAVAGRHAGFETALVVVDAATSILGYRARHFDIGGAVPSEFRPP
ncbi:hypothetical protein DFJ74DRAFT_768133, partial [Hyaloraphidium curvatum]